MVMGLCSSFRVIYQRKITAISSSVCIWLVAFTGELLAIATELNVFSLTAHKYYNNMISFDVQVFVNLPKSCVEKTILIRGIRPVCLWSKFFPALDLNKLPKNLKIEFYIIFHQCIL